MDVDAYRCTLPFRGDSAGAIFPSLTRRTSLNPGLPPKLEDIINKALEKDADLRYQSATDMHRPAASKARCAVGRPGTTSPSATSVPAPKTAGSDQLQQRQVNMRSYKLPRRSGCLLVGSKNTGTSRPSPSFRLSPSFRWNPTCRDRSNKT